MGRGLLTALRSLADRMPNYNEAIRLIRRQVAYRASEKPRRVQVVKISDIQAIMDDFYCMDRGAVESAGADSVDNDPEQSDDSEQSDQSYQSD
jgi:hypothetical protein